MFKLNWAFLALFEVVFLFLALCYVLQNSVLSVFGLPAWLVTLGQMQTIPYIYEGKTLDFAAVQSLDIHKMEIYKGKSVACGLPKFEQDTKKTCKVEFRVF